MRDEVRVQLEVEKLLANSLRPIRMAHLAEIRIALRPTGAVPVDGDDMHTVAQAEAIAARIQTDLGESRTFQSQASSYSDDLFTKGKGGDLGVISDSAGSAANAAAEQFSSHRHLLTSALEIRPSATTAPIWTPDGVYFIIATSTHADHSSSVQQLYSDARDRATDSEYQHMATKYVRSLRANRRIEVYLGAPLPGPPGVAATVGGENICGLSNEKP